MTEDEREELIQHLLEQFEESVGAISDDAKYAFIAGARSALCAVGEELHK